MRRALIALALLTAYHCVQAADWATKDTAVLGGALGLLAIDWAQTRKVTQERITTEQLNFRNLHVPIEVNHGRAYHETNPLLGTQPSNAEINRYFIIAMAGTTGLAYALPPNYRRYFLGAVIVVESLVVINNHQLGLRLSY